MNQTEHSIAPVADGQFYADYKDRLNLIHRIGLLERQALPQLRAQHERLLRLARHGHGDLDKIRAVEQELEIANNNLAVLKHRINSFGV